MNAHDNAVCAVHGVKKNYGGVKALVGVDLTVYPGTVHAVVGENGAGKSTLMKILVGAEQPDAGTMTVAGQTRRFQNVKEANHHGMAIVFQELSLFPHLDVLTNLFPLREPRRYGLTDRAAMRREAQPVLDELGVHVDLDAPVEQLTLGEQQLVEIAKALLADAKVLIFDEPNSALNAAETERLFRIIRELRERGVAILYISHRLEEVFEIADVITVMRNGEIVDTLQPGETSIPQVVSMMIGRDSGELSEFYARHESARVEGEPLRLNDVSIPGMVDHVSLSAYPGEIVGLAGLEGSGVSAVLDVVFGLQPVASGSVTLPNGHAAPRNIPAAVHAGIALIPADRRNEGLMLGQDVISNLSQITAGVLGRLGFFIQEKTMREQAQARSGSLNIKMDSLDEPVSNLSGGNQQKVVIGKWLEANPTIVLLSDPTRGVDVGAKAEIYHIIHDLAAQERIVLFTSTELPEFVHLCDRVIVFYRGRVVGELQADDLSTQKLLEAINTGTL